MTTDELLTDEQVVELAMPIHLGNYNGAAIRQAIQSAAKLGARAERDRAAKVCEEWGTAKVVKWAHDPEMCEDAKVSAWDALQCAAAIRGGLK